MLCPKQTSKTDLKLLYRDRWQVELDLRNIKTTLGMERLSCRHPDMAVKEIWVCLLAYNLIRMMMAQAARHTHRQPRQLSFKHTVQICIALPRYHDLLLHDDKRCILFELIAQQRVGDRPGRIEPRAVKRRPKPYPLLTQPREIARAKSASMDILLRLSKCHSTLGLILCPDKNDAVVKYTLGKQLERNIFASRYQLHLPTVKELERELRREVRHLAISAARVASKKPKTKKRQK